jgi:hypothetical protein
MHTISFFSFPTMKVNIHNQCSNFKLINREYSSSDADWNEHSTREVDIDSLKASVGAIMYELRRDHVGSTRIQLLVAWESRDYKKFYVYVRLIECNEALVWNEAKLNEYYQRYINRLSKYTSPIEDTWLIHDGTVLKTKLELTFVRRDGRLNVTISEGIKDDYTKVPIWIGSRM